MLSAGRSAQGSKITGAMRLPATDGKEEGKPSAQTVFDLYIESMGGTSPFLSCGGAAVNVRGGCRGIFATCRKAYNLHWVFGVDVTAVQG